MPLNEWLSNQEYARALLEDLVRKLNSAEVVDPERDGFFLFLLSLPLLSLWEIGSKKDP